MSAKAPAAMYFVISVFPISMTSGPPPPASVASNFWRWSPQFWYWTLTVQPGWSLWNCWLAAETTSAQPFLASTWSQTVRVPPWAVAFRSTLAVAVAAASASGAKNAAARIRIFIELSYGRRQERRTPSGLQRGRPSGVRRRLRLVHTTGPQGNARTQDRFCQAGVLLAPKTRNMRLFPRQPVLNYRNAAVVVLTIAPVRARASP